MFSYQYVIKRETDCKYIYCFDDEADANNPRRWEHTSKLKDADHFDSYRRAINYLVEYYSKNYQNLVWHDIVRVKVPDNRYIIIYFNEDVCEAKTIINFVCGTPRSADPFSRNLRVATIFSTKGEAKDWIKLYNPVNGVNNNNNNLRIVRAPS